MDCFDAPPDLTAPGQQTGRGVEPDERQQNEIERYLAAHASVAGTCVTSGPNRWAVSFTADGCQHRAALSGALGLPESSISIFRAANPQQQVEAVHRSLTAALSGRRHPRYDGCVLASWGPGLLGSEHVTILSGNPETLRRTLADDFADGNESMFTVTVTKNVPNQY